MGVLRISNGIKEKFNNFIEVTSDERPESGDIKLHMGIYYHCDDIWNPQVGDIRVQFYYAGLTGEPVRLNFHRHIFLLCFQKFLVHVFRFLGHNYCQATKWGISSL